MKYIVVPAEELVDITQETLDELHLVFRYNVDGTEVIMKIANYELLFPSAVTLQETEDEEPVDKVYPYPTYEVEALTELLNSDEWSNKEEENYEGNY